MYQRITKNGVVLTVDTIDPAIIAEMNAQGLDLEASISEALEEEAIRIEREAGIEEEEDK